MANHHTSQGGYVLGHSEFELKRLTRQAEMIDPMTRRFFQAAGIGPGMHVLDVGSGAGDVAFLLAELVGPTGSVTGVDRSATALDIARARTRDKGYSNVSFIEGELDSVSFANPFDAAAGRYVLMFQARPVELLSLAVGCVRPGGIVAFHEPDWRGIRSIPAAPTFDQCGRWLIETLIRTGTEHEMGFKLHQTFLDAGLPAPQMAVDMQVGGGESAAEAIELIADLTISMAGAIEQHGVATVAEIGPDSLHERIRAEVLAAQSVLTGRFELGAWGQTKALKAPDLAP